ncbi:PREDICTED: uncharacterized protein LOC108563041 [Nicrophorus vespilloides]|uniref:Uncharacterized protein LOC108563041 n=1 Tax=Nicrophorus vespilloides TaxID=110193 RepID=A0ABM1MR74_NICVS|nr:PREDICTED: uncharacterized protein LOC108563041 [Nicrophorus vespilloides]
MAKVVCYILVALWLAARGQSKYTAYFKNKALKFDKFLEPCKDYNRQHNAIDLRNVTITGNSTTFDYDAVMHRQINDVTLQLHFWRCSSREALDTCMPLTSFKCRNICEFLDSTKEFWSPAILCAKPNIACPLQKAVYRGRECSLNLNAFHFFPLGTAYWKVRFTLLNNKREILCAMIEGGIR